ncbi:MAG: hypothetical protein R3A52_12480 [Polyangiales bacterium]
MKRLLVPSIAILSIGLVDCGDSGLGDLTNDPTCSTTTFNVEGNSFVSFGTSADARKVDAFLRATLDVNTTVNAIHDDLVRACTNIGNDLGIPASEYVASSPTEPRVATVCNRVIREVRAVVTAALPANASLTLAYAPPICQADFMLAGRCAAECTASASANVPQCQGTVVADCSAACTGSCSGTCAASCTGTCSGTCTGGCMGTCTGRCEGTCSQMDANGNCNGTCTGTCTGTCSANCMGSCSGTCTAGCTGSCTGQCRGMCTGGANVRCDGDFSVMAEAQCRAACEARASATVACTRPELTVVAQSTVTPAAQARLDALIRSLNANYPIVLQNVARVQQLATSVPQLGTALNGAASAAASVGVRASACVLRAVTVTAAAVTKVQASVNVTVSFQASFTAGAGS